MPSFRARHLVTASILTALLAPAAASAQSEPADSGAAAESAPQRELRSPAAIAGGSLLTTVGVFPLVVGIAGLADHDEGRGEARGDYRPLAAILAVGGGLAVAGGITLIVWGSQEDVVPADRTAAMPLVRVGPTAASTTWSF